MNKISLLKVARDVLLRTCAPTENAMPMKSFFAAATMFAAAICAAPVHAGFLSGDITLDGSFSRLPDIGTSSIVSRLTFLDIGRSADVEPGATGWFHSADPNATANNINLLGPTHFVYIVSDSLHGATFTFLTTAISPPAYSAFECTGGPTNICSDKLTFDLSGVVSAAGFETTAFTGTWTGIGSCTADSSNTCIADVKGSWSAYLDPPQVPAAVPEPGTVMLLGLAFGLLGFILRRREA